MAENTDWATPGTKAAECGTFVLGNTVAVVTTITEVTETEVYTDNGERIHRYHRDTLTWDGDKMVRLLPLTNPDVRNVLARVELERLGWTVEKMARERSRGGVDEALAALDQIAEAVAATRAAITNPGGTR